MSRKLQALLFTLFGLFTLALSLLITFPWEALGRRLEAEFVKAQPGSSIAINEIGPALPLGLYVGDVALQLPGAPDKPGPKLHVDRLKARPSLLSLVRGRPRLDVDAEALGGELHARLQLAEGRPQQLQVDARALQLNADGLLLRLTGLDFRGELDIQGQLDLSAQGAVTDGRLDATIADAQIAPGKIKGFDFPQTNLGTPELKLAIEQGQATIERLGTRSEDVELEITGTLALRPQFMNSMIKGQLKLKPSDAWIDRSPLKPFISLAGSFRKPDGSFELPLNGPLSRPARLPF